MADGEDGGGGEEGCWDEYAGEGCVCREDDDGLGKIYNLEGGMGNHGVVLILVGFCLVVFIRCCCWNGYDDVGI